MFPRGQSSGGLETSWSGKSPPSSTMALAYMSKSELALRPWPGPDSWSTAMPSLSQGGTNPFGRSTLPNTEVIRAGTPLRTLICITWTYSCAVREKSQSAKSFSSDRESGGVATRWMASYGNAVARPLASSALSARTTSVFPAGSAGKAGASRIRDRSSAPAVRWASDSSPS